MLHKDMIAAGIHLGYPANTEGLCQGYTLGWVEAMLANEGELFNERRKKIQQDKEQLKDTISAVREEIKSKKELTKQGRDLLDLLGFYERIELYQTPDQCSGFFSKPLNQCNLEEISNIASSASIQSLGGLSVVYSEPVIYKLDELEDYFENLRKTLSSLTTDENIKNTAVLFNLYTNLHVVAAIYDHTCKQWSWYMDVEDEEPKVIHNTKELINKLAFKREYELVMKSQGEQFRPEQGKLYVVLWPNGLTYAVLDPLYDPIQNQITEEELFLDLPISKLLQENNLSSQEAALKPYLPEILAILSKRGHTTPRCLALNIKVITVKHNKHLAEWQKQLSTFTEQHPITRKIAKRRGNATLLYTAAKEGHLHIVNELFQRFYAESRISNTERFNKGCTPLHIAAQNGHLAVVEALLKESSSAKTENDDGATPLHSAALCGHLEIVKVLLKNDHINVNKETNNGATALFCAAHNGHLDVVQFLLEHPDININVNGDMSPIGIAARQGHAAIVNALLQHPTINVHEKSNLAERALYLAVVNRKIEVVNVLLNYPEININKYLKHTRLSHTTTPLLQACEEEDIELVKFLLDHNADPNQPSLLANYPLSIACKKNNLAMVQLLLDRNADVKQKDRFGNNPLFFACANGHVKIVEALLKKNIHLEEEFFGQATPLLIACTNNYPSIVKLLINHKANINHVVKNHSPLWSAAANGNFEIVKILLAEGANADIADQNGITPLMIAKEKCHENVAGLLSTYIGLRPPADCLPTDADCLPPDADCLPTDKEQPEKINRHTLFAKDLPDKNKIEVNDSDRIINIAHATPNN